MTGEEKYAEFLKYLADTTDELPEETDRMITTDFIKTITHNDNLTENEALHENEELTKSFGHIAAVYGFRDFYDLYSFGVMNDEIEMAIKAGQKDFSKLKKVTRTVMRNGKPTTMTFYESGETEEASDKKEEDGPAVEPPPTLPASSLKLNVVGDFQKPVTIKDLKLLGKIHTSLGGESGEYFDGDCSQYIILTDEQGEPKALIGIKQDEEYAYLSYMKSDSYTTGLAIRGFYQLLRFSMEVSTGAAIKLTENKALLTLVDSYDFKKKGDYYKLSKKEVKRQFGEF